MKIKVSYDTCEEGTYKTLDEAKEAIENAQASGVGIDQVWEEDEQGNETKFWGCTWTVELTPLE